MRVWAQTWFTQVRERKCQRMSPVNIWTCSARLLQVSWLLWAEVSTNRRAQLSPVVSCYSVHYLQCSDCRSRLHCVTIFRWHVPERDDSWNWSCVAWSPCTRALAWTMLEPLVSSIRPLIHYGYLPSLRIASGIRCELLKIPHVALCLLLYSGSVFLLWGSLKNSAKHFKRLLCNSVHSLIRKM